MKKPQWITAGAAVIVVVLLYFFGTTIPPKTESIPAAGDAGPVAAEISIDSILYHAKEHLDPEQVERLNALEHSVTRGAVRDQQVAAYRQLLRFWGDSAGVFEPYAWYEAELARLENSEKNLTFAARLFLENLQQESDPTLKKWKALQAKDLFERSLKINPQNDSAAVGLGACYLFGGITEMPMEGIQQIRQVLDRDSTNSYALMTLAEASLLTGQYDKAIERFRSVLNTHPDDLRAILMLADTYERKGENENARTWYTRSLDFISNPEFRSEVEKRINELKK